jgi:hypothetical protein
MNIGLGIGWSATDIDFWSYASGLDKTVERDEAEARERGEKEKEDEHAVIERALAAGVPSRGGDNVD